MGPVGRRRGLAGLAAAAIALMQVNGILKSGRSRDKAMILEENLEGRGDAQSPKVAPDLRLAQLEAEGRKSNDSKAVDNESEDVRSNPESETG